MASLVVIGDISDAGLAVVRPAPTYPSLGENTVDFDGDNRKVDAAGENRVLMGGSAPDCERCCARRSVSVGDRSRCVALMDATLACGMMVDPMDGASNTDDDGVNG